MAEQPRRKYILIGLGLLVLLALVYGFLPQTMEVETAAVERGPMQVIVEEEGETQLAQKYVIYAPNMAYSRRIDVEPGDKIEAGQPLVHLESPRTAILDARTRAEAGARVESARAMLTQAEENRRISTAAAEQASLERARIERLYENGSATDQQKEQAISADAQAQAGLEASVAALEAARANLRAAQAAFRDNDGEVREVLSAPVSGRILAVFHESAGPVNPGEPLLEIGDTGLLEISVDVLSQDAVRIERGTRVLIEQWGGDKTLEGTVSRVDPQGFTRISSLGVEEKRVNVIAAIESPRKEWHNLGTGYRVLARFVIWESDDVLQIPTSALFRDPESSNWAVLAIVDGEAVLKTVDIGYQSNLSAEVISGLAEGDAMIVHPGSSLEPGMRVKARE